jgi:hypothetical protein
MRLGCHCGPAAPYGDEHRKKHAFADHHYGPQKSDSHFRHPCMRIS